MEQNSLTPAILAEAISRLFAAPDELAQAANKAKAQGRPDAVLRLADLVEELMGRKPASA